jgi:haloacetate dehalogenase
MRLGIAGQEGREHGMFEGYREQTVKVGDAEIYVRVGGDGPPLLLLHGFPQTHVTWHKVAPLLQDRFTLILPDLRGYGRSRGPTPDADHQAYSKRVMARDMVELMSALGHDRFCLAGHDRGGRVGYRLCLDHPDRVRAFAPVDIIPTMEVWDQMDGDKAIGGYHWSFLAVPAPVPERLIGADPAFYYGHLLDRWAGDPAAIDPAARAAYLAQFDDPAVIAATCADYRAGASVDRQHDQADIDAGRKIACPVLVVWARGYLSGKTSTVFETWQHWADNVREEPIDCGHFIAEEKAEECAKALGDFFAKV